MVAIICAIFWITSFLLIVAIPELVAHNNTSRKNSSDDDENFSTPKYGTTRDDSGGLTGQQSLGEYGMFLEF